MKKIKQLPIYLLLTLLSLAPSNAYAVTADNLLIDLNQRLDSLSQEAQALGLKISDSKKSAQTESYRESLDQDVRILRSRALNVRNIIKDMLLEAPTQPALKISTNPCGGTVNFSYTPSSGDVSLYALNRNPDANGEAQWGRIAEGTTIDVLPKTEMNDASTAYQYILRSYSNRDVEVRSDIVSVTTPRPCSSGTTEISPYSAVIFTPDHGPAGTKVTLYWRGATTDINNVIELKNSSGGLTILAPSEDAISINFTIPVTNKTLQGGNYELFVSNSRNKSSIGKTFTIIPSTADDSREFVPIIVDPQVRKSASSFNQSSAASCPSPNSIITVGGIGSTPDDRIFAFMKDIAPGSTPISLEGKNINQNKSSIRNAIQAQLDAGKSVLVIAHSLGAALSFNLKNEFEGKPVKFIYIDSPYNNLGTKFDPFGFNQTANEIKKAKKNGIADDSNHMNWTNGKGSGKNHDPWTYPDYGNNEKKLEDLKERILKERCSPPPVSAIIPSLLPSPSPTASPATPIISPSPASAQHIYYNRAQPWHVMCHATLPTGVNSEDWVGDIVTVQIAAGTFNSSVSADDAQDKARQDAAIRGKSQLKCQQVYRCRSTQKSTVICPAGTAPQLNGNIVQGDVGNGIVYGKSNGNYTITFSEDGYGIFYKYSHHNSLISEADACKNTMARAQSEANRIAKMNCTPLPSSFPAPTISPSPSPSASVIPSSTPSPSTTSSPVPSSSASASPSVSASASPSSSSSPSSSTSPSPSGSGVSQKKENSVVASVFYAIGDFLDSIFSTNHK